MNNNSFNRNNKVVINDSINDDIYISALFLNLCHKRCAYVRILI